MRILIYQDYIHNNGVLHKRLCESFGSDNVGFTDASAIIEGALHDASLLVMPGGADLYFCEKLDGDGNKAIRHFVENGGIYLGICAGAYYACAEIEWAKSTDQEITGQRELSFYDGKATGPIHDFIEDRDVEKSWKNIVPVTWNGEEANCFYEAGPIFTGGWNADILACYATLPKKPAAILSCLVGKGLAILSSPHIEYMAGDISGIIYKNQNASYQWDNTLLSKSLPEARAIWHKVIEKIHDHNKTLGKYAA